MSFIDYNPPAFPIIEGVRFKPVTNFPGYAVSDDGHLWSCKRSLDYWYKIVPSIHGPKSYRRVHFYEGGKQTDVMLHVLIAREFIGVIPKGYEVAHFPDRDTANNAVSNLVITTPKENCKHRKLHGTESCGTHIVTLEMAATIKKEFAAGKSKAQLAQFLELGHDTINKVLNGTYQFRE